MDQQLDLRASDQDRQRVADRLKAAVDEGRLTLDEYDERLTATYAAKTYGELAAVTADLPAPPPPRVAPSRSVAPSRFAPWRPWLAASLITTAIWFLTNLGDPDGFGYFWPMWVIVPWGLVLALGGGRGCRPRRFSRS